MNKTFKNPKEIHILRQPNEPSNKNNINHNDNKKLEKDYNTIRKLVTENESSKKNIKK